MDNGTGAAGRRWESHVIYFLKSPKTNLKKDNILKQFEIVVEKPLDTYVAYPLSSKGVVVGQSDTYEAAVADVKSAIKFHVETFRPEQIDVDPLILGAFTEPIKYFLILFKTIKVPIQGT